MSEISYRLKILMGTLSVRKFAEPINENVNLDWLIKGDKVKLPYSILEKHETFQPITLGADRKQGVLIDKLQRILNEGDKTKIEAVKGMLKAFDPSEKKQGTTHEDDGGGEHADRRVA